MTDMGLVLFSINDKNVDLPKVKAFTEDNLCVTQMLKLTFYRVENIVGKAENAGNQHCIITI